MSSTGLDVLLFTAPEDSPNTLPSVPVWTPIRRTSDSLKKTVSLTESDEIIDTRYDQGSVATSAEAAGKIDFEFSAKSQDLFIEGAACNQFVEDGATGVSTVSIGGKTSRTFTIVKVYVKENIIKVFSGCRVESLEIKGDTEGKITGSVDIKATGYSEPAVSPVTNPLPASTTPFMSSINVNSFKIDGQTTVGKACAQSFTISIKNNLKKVACLGNQSLIPNEYKELKSQTSLSATVMLTDTSKVWIPFVESRQTVTAEIGIEDSLGNTYSFNFAKLELNNEGLSDTKGSDDNTLALEFNHVRVAPTITRLLV